MDELNKRNLNTSYTQFQGADIGKNSGVQSDQTAGLSALSNYVKGQGSFGSQQDTIMDTYAKRRQLATEGAEATAAKLESQYSTDLEDTQASDAAKINTERESQRGFTVNMGALREFVKAGDKRVRDLTKAKDELLLQNKANEASRLDTLLADEQTSITTARNNYLKSLLDLGSEARAVAGEGRAVSADERAKAEEKRKEQLFPYEIEKAKAEAAYTRANTQKILDEIDLNSRNLGTDIDVNTLGNPNLSSYENNTTVLSEVFKSNKITPANKTAIGSALALAEAAKSLVDANADGDFAGLYPGRGLVDFLTPDAMSRSSAVQNDALISALNLQTQFWASGAALTTEQTKDVMKMVPTKGDTDRQIKTKVNNLVNYMLNQTSVKLMTDGIIFKPQEVDLFDDSKQLDSLINQLSPEQEKELRNAGLMPTSTSKTI